MRYRKTIENVFPKNDNFLNRIDQQNYVIRNVIFNPDKNIVSLPQQSIVSLMIEDNLFDPFDKGQIIFKDNQFALERNSTQEDAFNGINFRGDGKDLYHLDILPVEKDEELLDDNFYDVFGYSKTFSIYDVENLLDDPNNILKKLSFYDYDKQLLLDKSLFFSTSKMGKEEELKDLIFKNNQERGTLTGIALREVLKNSLNIEDDSLIFNLDDAGNFVDFEDGKSFMFYTSPPNNKGYDDLLYFYDNHVSDSAGGDFSFLKKNNYNGKYSLESLSKIYEQNYQSENDEPGKLFFEKISISNSGDFNDDPIGSDIKSPKNSPSFGEKSSAINYNFFNINTVLNVENVNSKIVHSYNFKDKKFQFDVKDGNIENAKEVFNDLYVSGKVKGKDNLPFSSFVINNSKKLNYNYENVYSLYGENDNVRLTKGVNKLLKNTFLSNIGVEIFIKGQVLRKSGTFFSLERAENYIENDLDNKLLGSYLILKVEHILDNNNKYFNKLVGVKTHFYDDPKINEDIL